MKNKKKIPVSKMILPLFVIAMFIGLQVQHLNAASFINPVLCRVGMLMVMMLSATPTVYSGVGINYGVSVGCICGLVGAILGIMTGLKGLPLMLACILFSIPFAVAAGFGYGVLLKKVNGAEDLISTYTGFAFVSCASMLWIMLNPSNEALRFANGIGIRISVSLDGLFADVLTDFMSVTIGNVVIPVGFLMICVGICLLFALFMRSSVGTRIKACGYSQNFARAMGLNVNYYRTLSVIISTVLAAIGICIYAQTFGFYEFYSAYLNIGFTCVAGVFIGGATGKNVNMFNVIYGCVIYEAIMTLSTPLANSILQSGALPEIIRLLITNGVILYALTKGGKKEYA